MIIYIYIYIQNLTSIIFTNIIIQLIEVCEKQYINISFKSSIVISEIRLKYKTQK